MAGPWFNTIMQYHDTVLTFGSKVDPSISFVTQAVKLHTLVLPQEPYVLL